MRAILESGEEREFHFGQALLGHAFKELEVSLAEMQKMAKIDSWKRVVEYMEIVVSCRMLPDCSISLTL